jgi:hypothetical protein
MIPSPFFSQQPIDFLLNIILVKENIRPAFLFQPPSLFLFQEIETEKTKTLFPDLFYCDDYKNYQGTIISKQNYNGRCDITNEEMGKILGYPCYKGFDKINKNKPYYTIDIIASKNNEQFCLLTNVCLNKKKISMFENIAREAMVAFKKEKYDFLELNIEKVEVIVKKEIPTKFIIYKLTNNFSTFSTLRFEKLIFDSGDASVKNVKLCSDEKINEEEKLKIINILYNLGFSIALQIYFMDKFQYNNPIHRGILLAILLRDINDNLSPFFPLQNYPEQDMKVREINEKYETELIKCLIQSEV